MPRTLHAAKQARIVAYGLALLLGVCAATWMLPGWAWRGLLPPGAPPVADFAQQVVAQRYFLAQEWHWPLLHVDSLMAPSGINLAFADGNPLASLAAKLLRPILPKFDQVATVWLALCWILQPFAAMFAWRSVGDRRIWPGLVVAVMALSQPVFLWRIWHNSLASQFAILLLLGLYFRAARGARAAPWWAAALAALLLLVHPYMMVMGMAVLAAMPITLRARGNPAWRAAAAALFVSAFVVAGLMLGLGYTRGHSPGGYGVFSMNLVSPFWPARSGLLPWFPIADEDATGGQRESYNYLGAGLLLVLLAAGLRPPAVVAALRRHVGLAGVLVALTLLALSHRVYAFHTEILHVRTAVGLLQPLRASGRFFWVVAYTLLIGGSALVSRGRPMVAGLVLPLAASLQFADGSAIRARDYRMLREPAPWGFDPVALRPVLAAHARLTVLPPFGCTPGHDMGVMQPLWLAADSGMATNTMYLARHAAMPGCGLAANFAHAPAAGEVVMVQPGFVQSAMRAPIGAWCRQSGAYAVCSANLASLALLPRLTGDLPVTEQKPW